MFNIHVPIHTFSRKYSFKFYIYIYIYMGSRHNACLQVILEKVHSKQNSKIQKWSKMVRTTGGGLKMEKHNN